MAVSSTKCSKGYIPRSQKPIHAGQYLHMAAWMRAQMVRVTWPAAPNASRDQNWGQHESGICMYKE